VLTISASCATTSSISPPIAATRFSLLMKCICSPPVRSMPC
jgi:hypothetical protein